MAQSIAGDSCGVLEQPALPIGMSMTVVLRRLIATFCLLAALAALPAAAQAETAKVTFILINDIYQMGDTLMPDGQRRGGFARLAAVVKAERAKGRPRGAGAWRRHAVALADVGHRPGRAHRRR